MLMMMKKNTIIFIFVLFIRLSINGSYAQLSTVEAQYKYGSVALDKFLSKNLSIKIKKANFDTCLISVVFAKFTIDSLGYVKQLNFSAIKGTPKIFKTILSSVIMATNGSWFPRTISGRAVESRPFILPLIYDMEAGCTIPDSQIPNNLETNLLYMLSFDNNNKIEKPQLDCVILSPLHIFSIR